MLIDGTNNLKWTNRIMQILESDLCALFNRSTADAVIEQLNQLAPHSKVTHDWHSLFVIVDRFGGYKTIKPIKLFYCMRL